MRFFFPLIFLLISACGFVPPVGEKYKKPETKMPKAWNSGENNFAKIEQDWWKNFDDPILNQAIAIAIENNYDFKIAQSRVLEARSNVTSETSKLGPKVSASAGASRQNNYIIPIAPKSRKIYDLFTAGFDASWELDLFGGNYRSRQAAKALLEASNEAKNYILVSLIAEVVKNYSDLRAAQKKLFLQKEIENSYSEIVELNEQKKLVGLLSEIDFGRLKIAMLNSKSDLADAEAQNIVALYNLEELLGKKPGTMKEFFGDAAEVPTLRKKIIIDAPVSLLENRPDIKQAEHELAASVELKGYALAQLFPKISLSGFLGFYSTKSGSLIQPSSRAFSSGTKVTMPILDFGGVWAGKKIADQRKKQALLSYEEKVNKALMDVESSFANFAAEDKKLIIHSESFKISTMINDLNYQRYENGIISYVEYLQSKIDKLKAEQKLTAVKADFVNKTVAVYKSLGGGWEFNKTEGLKN